MKKVIVILFLTIIGFSVTAPLLERIGEDTFQTCQNNPHSGCDDGCCDDYCSPFHMCSHCHGFIFSTSKMDCSDIAFLKISPTPYKQPSFSLFCGDIWQPPKNS